MMAYYLDRLQTAINTHLVQVSTEVKYDGLLLG